MLLHGALISHMLTLLSNSTRRLILRRFRIDVVGRQERARAGGPMFCSLEEKRNTLVGSYGIYAENRY
jgi:hypothetical protein